MKTLPVLALSLCIATPVQADAWREEDTQRQLAATALMVIDWGQTLDISKQCGGGYYYETNPLLGTCPGRGDVNRHFAGSILLNYGIARVLPANYRKYWQHLTIAVEAGYVANNYSIGLKVDF